MTKAHNLNIYRYLKFLPEHRPNQNMTDEQSAELAPWSAKLQAIKTQNQISSSRQAAIPALSKSHIIGAVIGKFKLTKA